MHLNSSTNLAFDIEHNLIHEIFRSAFQMPTSRSYPRHLVQFREKKEKEKSILPPCNVERVPKGYQGLLRVTKGYQWLPEVTTGYHKLPRVTTGLGRHFDNLM